MTPERWQQIGAVFAEVDSADLADRRSVLERLCLGDTDLRREVEKLLAEDSTTGTFIQAVIAREASVIAEPAPKQERFGHYRIVRRIGQGGMGAVYEAERVDDFQKRVALKVIKQDFDSDLARIRFQQERQVLAALEHPYIARLLDGGESNDGSPYLVLEYVEGKPLHQYCEGLDRTARLKLFLKVCEAVEYAHRNLVVHRDLKPGNILVTESGEPKLLDFGIAKLLDPSSASTQTGLVGLTPDYASPEQVRGLTISTASDVYSLGVILYRLLTGEKPYSFETGTPGELDRIICIEPPAPPHLGDELDPIVLMAMRKEPERRYASVEQFAEDIRRYLDHRPVLARPDTFGYRSGKFIRRHWVALSAAAAVVIAIVAGSAVAIHQATIAQQRFDQVRKLAHVFVFDFHDDVAKLEGSINVRQKMVSTALEYLDSLSKSASGDLELQKELAAAYQKIGDAQGYPARPNLGRVDQAIESYKKAAELHQKVIARQPAHAAEVGVFYTAFADLWRYEGDYDQAARMADSARASLEQAARLKPTDAPTHRELARAWCVLGDVAEEEFRNSDAYEKFRKCDEIARETLKLDSSVDSLMMAQGALERVGTSSQNTGRLEESAKAFDEDEKLINELQRQEPQNPAFHRAAAILAQSRATLALDDDGPSFADPAACLRYSRQYLELAQEMSARDPNNAAAQFSVAIAQFRLSYPLMYSDPRAAVESARKSVQWFDSQIAQGHNSFLIRSRRAKAIRRLAEALTEAKQKSEALAQATMAVAEQRLITAHDSRDLQEANLLALALLAQARPSAGSKDELAHLEEAEQVSAAVFKQSPNELTSVVPLARIRGALAEYWKRSGDASKAAHWTTEAERLWREFPNQSDYVRRQGRPR